ncbi:hypothetical protein [Nonomuraea sp. NPDC048826]|uniref:hypothetical protein n=1 Tax=Nonomuraea sp. NPDC048826 TaxID=3364347 RepID=UPI00371657A3
MGLYRMAGIAGYACAVLLVFNVFRRGGLVPETAVTHAVAPFAALSGLFAITGLYLLIRSRAGGLGLAGYVLNAAGLAGAFAVEYALHFVFPALPGATVKSLLAGGTGMAFLVTSVVLMSGVLLFGVAAIRSGALPVVAVVFYAVGMVPGSLRGVVPEWAYLGGLVVAAAGVAWMAARLCAADSPGDPLGRPAGQPA